MNPQDQRRLFEQIFNTSDNFISVKLLPSIKNEATHRIQVEFRNGTVLNVDIDEILIKDIVVLSYKGTLRERLKDILYRKVNIDTVNDIFSLFIKNP
jgi:hypothetical protein